MTVDLHRDVHQFLVDGQRPDSRIRPTAQRATSTAPTTRQHRRGGVRDQVDVCRAMSHIHANPKPLVTRIKCMRGQLDAVERWILGDGECGHVLQQLTAVRGALNG